MNNLEDIFKVANTGDPHNYNHGGYKSSLTCVFKSGAQYVVYSTLSPEDVATAWNSSKRLVKLPRVDGGYVYFKKKDIDLFKVDIYRE